MSDHVGRFNRTAQESFVDDPEDLLFADLALFNRKLADGLVFDNAERPHHRHGPRSPLQNSSSGTNPSAKGGGRIQELANLRGDLYNRPRLV